MALTRSKLAIILSKVRVFENPKVRLEQYSTPSEIASDILWSMQMRGEIEGKNIVDLGCGTGILGLGALLLGAEKVFMVDIDKEALSSAKQNLKNLKSESSVRGEAIFLQKDAEDISKKDFDKVDTVIQNPPFGIKKKHADRIFLEKAMELSSNIYSFHKSESESFIKRLCEKKGFRVNEIIHYDYPLPSTHSFHSKKIQRIKAGCWNLKSL